MSGEQRDNSGVLFRNEKYEEGSNKPLYTGKCLVNGQELRMAAWIKEANNGQKFMSIQFTEPEGGSRTQGKSRDSRGGEFF